MNESPGDVTFWADKSGHALYSTGKTNCSSNFVFIERNEVVKRRQSILDDRIFWMTKHSDKCLDRMSLNIDDNNHLPVLDLP